MKKTRRLSDEKAQFLGFDLKPKTLYGNAKYTLDKNQYDKLEYFKVDVNLAKDLDVIVENESKSNEYENKFVLSAWDNDGFMMDIDAYCKAYGLPKCDITSYKLISHTGTPYYNIVFKENKIVEDVIDYDFIDDIVQKHIKPVKLKKIKIKLNDSFDRLIYTDVHIGMTPNEGGYSLYGGKWDEFELQKTLDTLIKKVINNKKGNLLVIDELGDLVDGWDGETVRKGHHLPQNMDNQKMFDVALDFKVKMIDALINIYPSIICNNICEDNHAGAFGYVINSSFKKIIKQKYEGIVVNNHRKFINHYFIGKHCFVISHGKDSKNLKFGFKTQLDTKQVEKIDQYLKQNKIYGNAKFIEFSKGDSHQMILDYTTSSDFDYFNYPPLSPSSEWIQTNFKNGRSGFVIQNVSYEKNEKIIKPFFF